jgi:hypothetical protein
MHDDICILVVAKFAGSKNYIKRQWRYIQSLLKD